MIVPAYANSLMELQLLNIFKSSKFEYIAKLSFRFSNHLGY